MTNTPQNLNQILDDALHTALQSLARDNIAVDVQQLLVHGFDKLNAKPNALRNALSAVIPRLALSANKRDASELVSDLINIEGKNRRLALDAAAMITHLSMDGTKPVEAVAVPSHVIDALQASLAFIEGFAGDEMQEGIPALIGKLKKALSTDPAQQPDDTAATDGSMSPEEVRLENLKQMAMYDGAIVSFECREPYYLASCDCCGWVGSSELCGTDSFGDDSDVYCPRCQSSGADCGKVAERITCQPVDVAAVRDQALGDAERRLINLAHNARTTEMQFHAKMLDPKYGERKKRHFHQETKHFKRLAVGYNKSARAIRALSSAPTTEVSL